MSRPLIPTRPRVVGSNSVKYVNKNITLIGEVISLSMQANTAGIRTPDDETMVVFLPKSGVSKPIEMHRLIEVTGKLVSRGQIELESYIQFDAKQTALFNKQLYVEAALVMEAHRRRYDI